MNNAVRLVVGIAVLLILSAGASIAQADLIVDVTGVEPGADVFVTTDPGVTGVAGKGIADASGNVTIRIKTTHTFKKGDKALIRSSKEGSKLKHKGQEYIGSRSSGGDHRAKVRAIPA